MTPTSNTRNPVLSVGGRTDLYHFRLGGNDTELRLEYEGGSVEFTSDGWINGTAITAQRGKRLDNWLRLAETKRYMRALAEALNTSDVRDLLRTMRGRSGGTWLHPKLAVSLARWIDVRFDVWCDLQIDPILRAQHSTVQLPAPTSKRSAVADREPLFVLAGKCVARYGWRFTIVYIAMSLYAGAECFRTMDCAQVCDAADFGQHLLDGAVTDHEWQRLAVNRALLGRESTQLSLFGETA